MMRRKYWFLFSIVIIVAAALVIHVMVIVPGGVLMDDASNKKDGVAATDKWNMINLVVPLVFAFLLSFSVINSYTTINSNHDELKSQIINISDRLGSLEEKLEKNVDEVYRLAIYERNFLRLNLWDVPDYIRAQAAGYFITSKPDEGDRLVLISLLQNLDDDVDAVVKRQLRAALDSWDLEEKA